MLCKGFLSFLIDKSVCMNPGCVGCTKSQMSMLSSYERLMIWKSSNCRLSTVFECSCGKSNKRIISRGQATQIKCTQTWTTCHDCSEYTSLNCTPVVEYWFCDVNAYLPLMTESLLCHTNIKIAIVISNCTHSLIRRTHYQAFHIMLPFESALQRQFQ